MMLMCLKGCMSITDAHICDIQIVIVTPRLCLQNSSIDSQKRNSVRHKLVSLTLKRKSKIAEEVRFEPATFLQ